MTQAVTLRLENVSAGYGHTTVLERIEFSVSPGEKLGIIGRNGAGKTTTLATAMGLTQLRAGKVYFNGQDVSSARPSVRAQLGLGYVPQTRDIFPSLTVEENLRSAVRKRSAKPEAVLLTEAYQLFPRLNERKKNWGNELSGGEQQMLSIARALMGEPALLLLDEPLEGLAPVVAQEVMGAIRTLSAQGGMGIVLVEQQVELVLNFSTNVMVLERGRTVYYGSSDALKNEHRQVLDLSIGLKKVTAVADA